MNLLRELRRRNVHKVALVYAVLAWLLIELLSVFFPMLDAPDGFRQILVGLIAAGFPIALLIAWRYEMTPTGLKRTEHLTHHEILPYWSKRKFTTFVVGTAVLAAALFIFQCSRVSSPARHAGADASESR